MMSLTTDRNAAGLSKTREDGQQEQYLVLSEADRAQGFIRPVRLSYCHVRKEKPTRELRELTADEHYRYDRFSYVKFEAYPPSESSVVGRYWTQKQLDEAAQECGTITTMSRAIAETYARDPAFYSATFCTGCGKHFPLKLTDGSTAFTWCDDGEAVGS